MDKVNFSGFAPSTRVARSGWLVPFRYSVRQFLFFAVITAAFLSALSACSRSRRDPFGSSAGSGSGSGGSGGGGGGGSTSPTATPTPLPTYSLWRNGGMAPLPNSFMGVNPLLNEYSQFGSIGPVGVPDNITGDGTSLMINSGNPIGPNNPPTAFTPWIKFLICPSTTSYSNTNNYVGNCAGAGDASGYFLGNGRIEFNVKLQDAPSNYNTLTVYWGQDLGCLRYFHINPVAPTPKRYPSTEAPVPALSDTQFIHVSIRLMDFYVDCPVQAGMFVDLPLYLTLGRKQTGTPSAFYINDVKWTP